MKEFKADTLVIGVSTRALFDLEEENNIFEEQGIDAFRDFQFKHEEEPLKPGTAFYLIQSLLELNTLVSEPIVEVVVMSRNSPETGMRVLNSIKTLNLGINRMAFTGGRPLAPYMDAFGIDLFLSKDQKDVQKIIDSQACAAAFIYAPPLAFNAQNNQVKIAFDADAVVFSEESELVYKTKGIEAFLKHESVHENIPLNEGPFGKLLKKLSAIQSFLPKNISPKPLRIAIVTARSAPSHLRVIKTLREWGVDIDEAYFMGGLSKNKVLKAFGAHIFFDDQEVHLTETSQNTPSGRVPYRTNSLLNKPSLKIEKLK